MGRSVCAWDSHWCDTGGANGRRTHEVRCIVVGFIVVGFIIGLVVRDYRGHDR
ncbi:hypothetical protein N806_08070 [Rhodococcus sp. P27]|nr:hypothetical protein N806_08070 [Rhodococcus sp. P27]